jgi:hypothetical protein
MNKPNFSIIPKPGDSKLVDALRSSPLARKAVAEHEAATLERRTALVAEIEKLDKNAARELPPLQADVETALAEFNAAQDAMLGNHFDRPKYAQAVAARILARGKIDVARDKSVNASLAYSSRRDALERELRESAAPEIKLFKSEMLTAFWATRNKPPEIRPIIISANPLAGTASRAIASNAASAAARMRAIRAAMDQADLMALEPDQRGVDVRLEKLRHSLPAIGRPEIPKPKR